MVGLVRPWNTEILCAPNREVVSLDSATRWRRQERKFMTLGITSGLSSSAIVVLVESFCLCCFVLYMVGWSSCWFFCWVLFFFFRVLWDANTTCLLPFCTAFTWVKGLLIYSLEIEPGVFALSLSLSQFCRIFTSNLVNNKIVSLVYTVCFNIF